MRPPPPPDGVRVPLDLVEALAAHLALDATGAGGFKHRTAEAPARAAQLLQRLTALDRGEVAWIDLATTAGLDHNHYADPPFRYCPPGGCGDPVACGQSMSCHRCDGADRSAASRAGTFHELPICRKPTEGER